MHQYSLPSTSEPTPRAQDPKCAIPEAEKQAPAEGSFSAGRFFTTVVRNVNFSCHCAAVRKNDKHATEPPADARLARARSVGVSVYPELPDEKSHSHAVWWAVGAHRSAGPDESGSTDGQR